MKRVMTLYRVSTKKQYDNVHDDIPMQRLACQEFVEQKRDWVIVHEFYEALSGFKVSASKRDAVQDLKEAALKGEFDILLVFMFDRIGRIDSETPFVVEWFAAHGIEVWSTKEGQQSFENQTDKLVNYIRFWQANGESVKTSIRVKTVMQQLTEAGVYHGGVTPFGYRVVDTGQLNKKGCPIRDMEIEPREAMIVKLIFEKTYYEGYGSYQIAEELNAMGIRTHNGSKFQSMTIIRILRNRIYCGYYVFGETVSPKIDKLVIVEEFLFDGVQEILDQRSKKQTAKQHIAQTTKGKTLLSGNVVCGCCGTHMASTSRVENYTRTDGTVTKRKTIQYVCYHRTRRLNDCTGQSVYVAERIDNEVSKIVEEYLQRIKESPREMSLENHYQKEIDSRKKACKALMKEKEKISNRLNELSGEIGKSLTGESAFSTEILSSAIESTKQELEKVERELRIGRNELENQEQLMGKLDFYYEQFVGWADEFKNASLERKKMILCQLIEQVKVSRGYKIEIVFNVCYEQFLVKQ